MRFVRAPRFQRNLAPRNDGRNRLQVRRSRFYVFAEEHPRTRNNSTRTLTIVNGRVYDIFAERRLATSSNGFFI